MSFWRPIAPGRHNSYTPLKNFNPPHANLRRASTVPFAEPMRAAASNKGSRVLVFDVMDTIVFDPFYTQMASFFGLTFKELLAAKHPTAWVEFEKGLIDEREFYSKFFADGRNCDGSGLRDHMVRGLVK